MTFLQDAGVRTAVSLVGAVTVPMPCDMRGCPCHCAESPVTCGDVPLLSAFADASQDRGPEQMAEVHVDIRKFLQFLAGQQSNPTRAVCSECTGHTLRSPVVSRAAHGPCRVAVRRLGAEASTRGPLCRGGRRACVSPGAGARGRVVWEALTAPPAPLRRNRE